MGFAYKDKKSLAASKSLSEIIDDLKGGQLDQRSAGVAMDALQLMASKGKFDAENIVKLAGVAPQYPTALTRVLMVPRAAAAIDQSAVSAIEAIAADLTSPEVAYGALFSVTTAPRHLGLQIQTVQRRDERAAAIALVTPCMLEDPEIISALIKSVEALDYTSITACDLLKEAPVPQAQAALTKASKKSSYPELSRAALAALAAMNLEPVAVELPREERLLQFVVDTFQGVFDVVVDPDFRPSQDMEEHPESFLEVLAEAAGVPAEPFVERHTDSSLRELAEALINDSRVE